MEHPLFAAAVFIKMAPHVCRLICTAMIVLRLSISHGTTIIAFYLTPTLYLSPSPASEVTKKICVKGLLISHCPKFSSDLYGHRENK
jgi:hypothetical protein